MSERIFRGILTVAMAVLAICLILVSSILYSYFSNRSWDELKAEASFIGMGVERTGIDYLDEIQEYGNVRVTWVAADGTVLFDSVANAADLENHQEREEIQEARESGEGSSERYSTTLSEKTINYAKKLSDDTILRVSGTQNSVLSLLIGMAQPLIAVITIVVFGSMFLAYRISRNIVKPINEMDLEHPRENAAYKELQPLLQRLERQYEQIEQGVEDKEKIRREFSANVSHELKTPLTSISGIAEIMKNDMVKPEDVPHFAGNIYKESQRLIALVEDIMKISQLDENQVQLDQEPINLAEIIRQEAERVRPAADKKGVTIHLELPSLDGRQPVVKGIRQILREMFFNLLDNAVKYNKENGSITCSIRWENGHVVASVADTGIGIPKKDQQRVFERFYRVDKSHSKAIGGTGLGLSIVKHGAAYHQAEIELESQLGKGTTITVRF